MGNSRAWFCPLSGREEIVNFYQVPAQRIHILPHPTPAYALAAPANSADLARFDLPADYLFYPAQFWAHKNHINLLLALKQLREKGLRVPLVLTGSDFGNLRFVQEQVSALGLHDQVKILGFVSQEEMIALYRGALGLSYMSFFGPENLPPLEAFALGCPVIAAQVSGADEQMGNAAILVDPADPAAIAAAIRKLHSDKKLRQQLIARGRKRAAKWTVQDFVRGAFEILDSFESVRRTWGD
jgi:glycosyltransferase involved in cell wall biosynthesis